jgi:hypothetical protein
MARKSATGCLELYAKGSDFVIQASSCLPKPWLQKRRAEAKNSAFSMI